MSLDILVLLLAGLQDETFEQNAASSDKDCADYSTAVWKSLVDTDYLSSLVGQHKRCWNAFVMAYSISIT